MDILKVSSKSKPGSLAGAIMSILKKDGIPEIQAIGAGAVNQAVKGVAIAGGFAAQEDKSISTFISFADVEVDGEKRTAMKMTVEYK